MIIYSQILVKILSFGFARAMALYPFILTKVPLSEMPKVLINHEKIHLRQQIEMALILFYFWYLIEYLIKLIIFKNHYLAYRNISFEREAYNNETNLEYLSQRKFWSFLKYV